MRINSIHFENYKAYKEFDCDFRDGLNIIIGDNGAGKTSLLSGLSLLLSAQLSKFGQISMLDPGDPYMEVQRAGDATLSVKEYFPVIVSGDIDIDADISTKYEIRWNNLNSYNLSKEKDTLYDYLILGNSFWPLINFQSFDRNWKIGKEASKRITVETGLNDRKDGYNRCLYGKGIEKEISEWCLKMSMLEFEKKGEIKEFRLFKSIIKTFMQTIEDYNDEIDIDYSVEFSGLVLKTSESTKPLYELSTGYKTLLSMIMELSYRTALLNPKMDNVPEDLKGVVMIDEIDAHLHPKWQWRIIDALVGCFPKIQFIIATHSPIVISSAKNAHMIILDEGNGVRYDRDAYGYNVDDVLSLRQGSSSVPSISEEFMNKLEDALDTDDLVSAEKVVSDAEKEFGPDSPAFKELRHFLEINRWVEEN